ncbi:MAG: tetratricopeptide repeat protein [Acetobacteraceae bacterium]
MNEPFPSFDDEPPARRAHTAYRLGDLDEAEDGYRAAVAANPTDAASWSNLALVLRARARPHDAEQAARVALILDPDLSDAHNSLGMAQHDLTRLAEAENSFGGAIRLRPGNAAAWVNLGVVRQSRGALDEAEVCYREALRLGAGFGQVGGNLGMVLLEQGRPEEAEAACRAGLEEREGAATRMNLAMALLQMGRMEEGWAAYEARLDLDPLPGADDIPLWDGVQPVAGRTLLLRAEQGLGDTLQFCRYAPMLAAMGAEVVLEVQAPLVRLLHSLSGVARVVVQSDAPPPADLQCRLMSLPHHLGTTLETIPGETPYLRPDPAEVAEWGQRLSTLTGRLRVGLVWGGAARPEQPHAQAGDARRSMPLAAMAPLAQVAGCDFVSLQVGQKAAEAADPPASLVLHNVTADLRDFADTAALVANLDLVIAVDTSVAHLAGAIGKPVWLLNRHAPCWRWLQDRMDSPWYPVLRQFRQTEPGDWTGVMLRVRAALEQEVQRTCNPACLSPMIAG